MKLHYVVYIDKESTSAGLYGGILPVVDTCTIPYVDVLYMDVNVDCCTREMGKDVTWMGTYLHRKLSTYVLKIKYVL